MNGFEDSIYPSSMGGPSPENYRKHRASQWLREIINTYRVEGRVAFAKTKDGIG